MALYHFTDPSNLDSIARHGLLSWPELLRRGIAHRPASTDYSRELDRRRSLEDYIHLCLEPDLHPMAHRAVAEGRVRAVCWLAIEHDALREAEHVLYSDTNAAAWRARIDESPDTAYSGDRQAEVLVCRWIAPRWISVRDGRFWRRLAPRRSTLSAGGR